MELDEGAISCFNTKIGILEDCDWSNVIEFVSEGCGQYGSNRSEPERLQSHDKGKFNQIMYADDLAIILHLKGMHYFFAES